MSELQGATSAPELASPSPLSSDQAARAEACRIAAAVIRSRGPLSQSVVTPPDVIALAQFILNGTAPDELDLSALGGTRQQTPEGGILPCAVESGSRGMVLQTPSAPTHWSGSL